MSGRRYHVVMAPSAHRRYKKLAPTLQDKIREQAASLAEDPYHHEELKGPLKGIRSYHFHFEGSQYRIAYRVVEDKDQVEVILVKSRENFYETLRRILE